MAASAEGGFLSAPPTEFKRMLSWQLSQPRVVPVKRKKQKAKRARKQSGEGEEPEVETGSGRGQDSDEDLEAFAYVVVNSEGEEEAYYSAPESPVSSEDETTSFVDDSTSTPPSSERSVPGRAYGTSSSHLPEQTRKPGGRSKKHKKRDRYLTRLAQAEFFQPLCNLVESQLSLEVGQLEVSSHARVPSLVELSIRKIQRDALVQRDTEDLPFLVHSLLGHDRELRSTVSTHVRWLERVLAAHEAECHNQKERRYSDREGACGFAYSLQDIWAEPLSLDQLPGPLVGLHCPLPCPADEAIQSTRLLLHFTNYLFPVFTTKAKPEECQGSTSLSPSQLAAVTYVNKFVETRYKELAGEYTEFLKLWPGYVYWARGQVKLAADAFVGAISSLKHPSDQAVALNELGRMFLHFGDRRTACRFFRQSTELPDALKDRFQGNLLQELCASALRAAAWDCGWLDASTARVAARSWDLVLKEGCEIEIWYIHLAACESRMFVQAGRPVGDITSPTERGTNPTLQWLQECKQLVSGHTQRHPILHYHSSLLNAMMGSATSSSHEFRNFENGYSGFREWEDGIVPGQLFTSHLFRHQQPLPWQPLIDMLTQQCLDHAPVMSLQWRLRLMHPMYPYLRTGNIHRLADHASPAVGLRLTGKGHLTADLHMDLPPMRCLLIDPYTGSLVFSRKESLQHYSTNSYQDPSWSSASYALPWPLRLVEVDDYVVELALVSSPDLEVCSHGNYRAVLHRYNAQGTHHQVDLRRAIRRQLKQVLLDLASDRGLDDKGSLLDKLLELGYYIDISSLKATKPQPKYTRRTVTVGRGKAKKTSVVHKKFRNSDVKPFSLQLSHHTVFGEGTLMMAFHLTPCVPLHHTFEGQVLVFVNCTSSEKFLKPQVHCVGDGKGFSHLYPRPEDSSVYHHRHYRHIKYAIAGRTEVMSDPAEDHYQMVFNENGDAVYEKSLRLFLGPSILKARHKNDIGSGEMKVEFSLGQRVFTTRKRSNPDEMEVCSFCPCLEDADEDSEELVSPPFKVQGTTTVVPVPGIVFVHTTAGLSLLHPGSLEPLEITDLQDRGAGQQRSTEEEDQNPQIQLKGAEMFFNLVRVYDIEGCLEVMETEVAAECVDRTSESESPWEGQSEALGGEEGEEVRRRRRRKYLEGCDYGSCRVAFTVNNRLIILHVPHWAKSVKAELDVRIPGKVTELYPMGKFGLMLSATQFPDRFREEMYWISETGRLLGVLPCLGAGPRSFISATLPPRPQSPGSPVSAEGGREGGLHVFFYDGKGAICCVRPSSN